MSTERQTFVEIDLPVCSLTYGESPCTAVLNGGDPDDFGINANNTRKCYNTRSTCQDLPNFNGDDIETPPKVLRLAVATLNLDPGIMAIPSIVDVSYTPPRINLAQGLGERSVVKITVQDHPFPDTGPAGDKYLDDRDFDAFGLGTFWGKFRTRYPFMRGRTLRWKTGIVGTTIDNMETREFVIDRIDGPDVSGRVVITAKDPVSFLDDQRSLTPRLSGGQLIDDETGTITTLTITPAEAITDYPAGGGFVSVGGTEIMRYSSTSAPNILNISARGQFGTTQQDHSKDERVQLCRVLDDGNLGAIRADEFLIKLLTEDDFGNAGAGPVNPAFIPAGNWQFEAETFLAPSAGGELFTGIITEPEPIADIVNEFCESIGASIWWNDLEQKLEFQTLRSEGTDDNKLYSDGIILADTFQQRTMERSRASRVWIFYAPLNALEQTEDKNNYLQSFVNISGVSEVQYGSASVREVFSRFIPGGSRSAAERTAQFLLARYALPPRRFTFTIPRDDDNFIHIPVLGESIRVESRFIQNDIGEAQIRECQVIGIVPSSTTCVVEAEEINRSDVPLPAKVGNVFTIPVPRNVETGLNISALIRTALDDQEIEAGDIIRVVIEENVTITNIVREPIFTTLPFTNIQRQIGTRVRGSGGPALITGGDFPAGVTVQIRMLPGSLIVGAGGRGGSATLTDSSNVATQGEDGSDGIVATEPMQIFMDPTSGIAGGGGGGAGVAARGRAQSALRTRSIFAASSGGGGQPFGLAGSATFTATTFPESRFRVQNGSRASFAAIGQGIITSITATLRFLGITLDRRTVTVTSGDGGAPGQPGEGSSATSANVGSQTHAAGGAQGFSIKGKSNLTFPDGEFNITSPTQADP